MRIVTGNLISVCMLILATIVAEKAYLLTQPLRMIVLLICWFAMLYFSHCLSHYIVGRLLGIEFRYYFLSKSMLAKAGIPVISKLFSAKLFLTLKLAEKPKGWRGFAMFIAGPLASMLSPLLIVAIAYGYDARSAELLLALTIFNAIFTGYFSTKHGCIRKALDCVNLVNPRSNSIA